ncbi:alpha/beta hydrolase [Sinomonas sp. ASV486]|uniref:Alpha/beta fold hydrolase n=1 Tax=Sinomonas puerhi TaxID=3238584 RepID=A0AB39L3P4_9MICC|nr:alpha/beta hydrolase [Sinomonas sp. ASV486]MDQ4491317.1 alpha/beta hydrolase [Sinomonas sp. ASV486]
MSGGDPFEGMPSFRLGTGRPLVVLPGLTPRHVVPRGTAFLAESRTLGPLARSREVWWVNRRAGLGPDATMEDIAADYADRLPRLGAPVDVMGISTGGIVALQLAADRPDLVRRLVLVASGCRLGPAGKVGQRALLARLEAGDLRGAGSEMVRLIGVRPAARSLEGWAGWLVGPLVYRGSTDDLAVVLRAEDAFDLTARLTEISVPTLVIGGDEDTPYGPAVFRETARGLPNGRLIMYYGRGHVGVQLTPGFAQDVLGFLDAP